MTIGYVEKTIEAEDVFSDEIAIHDHLNYSVSGISGDTVVLQRSYDGGTIWKDAVSLAADAEDVYYETEMGVIYRIGVKAGGYDAGTILARISF